MGNPIYRSPSSSSDGAPHSAGCTEEEQAARARRHAATTEVLWARVRAAGAGARTRLAGEGGGTAPIRDVPDDMWAAAFDSTFASSGDEEDGPGPRTRQRREGMADAPAGGGGSAWGVGLRWALPPLPAVYQMLPPGPPGPPPPLPPPPPPPPQRADFMDDGFLNPYLRREPVGGATTPAAAAAAAPPPPASTTATATNTRSVDRLRRELMLSALDPADWDVVFGRGGGGSGLAARRRAAAAAAAAAGAHAGADGRARHPSHVATQLLRASAGDAAARVMEVQATLAALEGRLGALEAARRARAATAAAAGRMV